MEKQLLFIIALPLAGFLINLLAGRFLNRMQIALVAVLAVLIPFGFVVSIFFSNLGGFLDITHTWFSWLSVGQWQIDVAFRLDNLSVFMSLIILGIGSLIHIYSYGYMFHEQGFNKFFAYLNLFIFFMLLLVMGENLLIVFLGWEGVGLCSYLLIGFYHQSFKAANAAKKAFVFNRIGDFGFLAGSLILFNIVGSLSFSVINTSLPAAFLNDQVSLALVSAICLLFFLAATGKSAQLPLFTWLPDAMEGPTPVSALIHAATMVTAGIYLIVRMAPVFELSLLAKNVILYTGLATALVSALIATRQFDVKRILAYSTVSQLGYIFMALGVGAYGAAMFHLMTHAFFKALLFLAAGSLILQLEHIQDASMMGKLKKLIPQTALVFMVGAWSISGMPLGPAFFSKDEILWHIYQKAGLQVWLVAGVVSFLTAYYTYRMIYLVFYRRDSQIDPSKINTKSPKTIGVTLGLLAVCSLLVGFLGLPHYLDFFGIGNLVGDFLQAFSFAKTSAEFYDTKLEVLLALATLIIAFLGFLLARLLFKDADIKNEKPALQHSLSSKLLTNKFFIDEIYQDYIKSPLSKLSLLCEAYLEKLFYFFSTLIKRIILRVGSLIGNSLQTGNVQDYALATAVSIVIFIIYFLS